MSTSTPNALTVEQTLHLIQKARPVISGKWRLSIILLIGGAQAMRFGQLRERLALISDKVLVSELKALVVLDVIARQTKPDMLPGVEYALTKRGQLALPMLLQIQQIGQLFT